jgi:hypothetical protein
MKFVKSILLGSSSPLDKVKRQLELEERKNLPGTRKGQKPSRKDERPTQRASRFSTRNS